MPSSFPNSGDARLGLDRLSSAERQVLEMLAQGHTVKSIAGLTGRSESAVNERLRDARRKTGIGSSRELARLLSTQKIRDEEIGVTMPARMVAGVTGQAAPGWVELASAKGALLMIFILGATATALLLTPVETDAPDTSPSSINDPMLETALPPDAPSARDFHSQVRRETRDAAWAARTEAALRARYGQIPHVGGSARATRATCGATLCEVAGTIAAGANGAAANAAMQSLQGSPLRDDVRRLGLDDEMITFGPQRGDARTLVFVAYWKRLSD